MNAPTNKEVKLPPIEKIAEAYSVIANNRIEEVDENTFLVVSSNGEKSYKVTINGDRFRSNDSATKFARYAGYPILAVLMYQHRLPLPDEYLKDFKDINWNQLNKEYKRDYAAALDAALESKNLLKEDIVIIKELMRQCYQQFKKLHITI